VAHAFAQHVHVREVLLFEQRKETALQIAGCERQEVLAAGLVRVALFFGEQIRPPGDLQPLLVVSGQGEFGDEAWSTHEGIRFGVGYHFGHRRGRV